MCCGMADNGIQNQEGVPENLRKLLAVAVRSVQWSYAIFWSLSSEQEGVLEWGDGYYNGDIKTRKTVEAMELKADKMGLQRSEQLRELYGSLLEGETDEQQAKRPCASLSPEDLTDAEWFYLVCMSFVFHPGQGLPGRALANGQSIWLCNAHCADSKVFSRSLLAKSASIQTVLCFPHLGGVVELGVTELVLEDPTLIQHIKTSILEFSKPKCSEKSTSANVADDDTDHMCIKIDNGVAVIVDTMALENICTPIEDIGFDQEGLNELDGKIHENSTMGSPEDCSNGCEHNHQTEDSQVQSWHYMDDDYSNCFPASMNSSDCISQVFVNQEKGSFPPTGGNGNTRLRLNEIQDCHHTKLSSLDLGNNEDSHYTRTVSMILRNSQGLIENLWFQSCDHKSVFVSWKKEGIDDVHRPKEQQRMLKMVLLNVPLMHSGFSLMSQKESSGEDRLWKPEKDEVCVKYILPEKRTENGKFMVLRSMVPSISKIDKESILGDTIEYLKELEARVEELESCIYLAEPESRARPKDPDMIEQTSDSYDIRRIEYGKRPWINKRKACEIDENDSELKSVVVKEVPLLDMKVSIEKEEVLIEMRCPWREYLLPDIMDAVNNLNLDAHSVQSSTINDVLTLTLHSKFRGAEVASTKMIKQALARIAGKC